MINTTIAVLILLLSSLSFAADPRAEVVTPVSDGPFCTTVTMKIPVYDPVVQRDIRVSFRLVLPKVSNRTPFAVVTTSIYGYTPLEFGMEKLFCMRGIAVAIAAINGFEFERGARGLPELRHHTFFGNLSVKALMDHISVTPRWSQIDVTRTSLVGVSNGTVNAAMIASADARVKALILLVGIGNVPGVMVTTDNPRLKAFAEEQMAYYHMNDKVEFQKFVRSQLQIDPLDVAHKINPAIVLQVRTAEDLIVLPQYQEQLWQALGRPKTFWFQNGNHEHSIEKMVLLYSDVFLNFIRDRIGI